MSSSCPKLAQFSFRMDENLFSQKNNISRLRFIEMFINTDAIDVYGYCCRQLVTIPYLLNEIIALKYISKLFSCSYVFSRASTGSPAGDQGNIGSRMPKSRGELGYGQLSDIYQNFIFLSYTKFFLDEMCMLCFYR